MSCTTPPPNKPFQGCMDEPKAIAYIETEPHPIDRTVELLKQLSENGKKAKKKTGHPFEKYMKAKRTK